MKVLSNQTFWLGAMTAFAVGFFFLFVGTITGKVSFDFDKMAKGNKGYAAPSAPAANDAVEADAGYGEEPTVTVAEVTESDWLRGNPDAEITIVEYSDIDCPFCSRFHTTMNEILTQYDGQVNWVYRDFPLDGLHPQATAKAISAECVGKLAGNDSYWKFLDALFEGTTPAAAATTLGINAAELAACEEDPSIAEAVKQDIATGSAAGARGTPFSVMIASGENTVINGAQPTSQVSALIDAELAK